MNPIEFALRERIKELEAQNEKLVEELSAANGWPKEKEFCETHQSKTPCKSCEYPNLPRWDRKTKEAKP